MTENTGWLVPSKTKLRHLKTLAGHLENNDFSSNVQDRALRAGISELERWSRIREVLLATDGNVTIHNGIVTLESGETVSL